MAGGGPGDIADQNRGRPAALELIQAFSQWMIKRSFDLAWIGRGKLLWENYLCLLARQQIEASLAVIKPDIPGI